MSRLVLQKAAASEEVCSPEVGSSINMMAANKRSECQFHPNKTLSDLSHGISSSPSHKSVDIDDQSALQGSQVKLKHHAFLIGPHDWDLKTHMDLPPAQHQLSAAFFAPQTDH